MNNFVILVCKSNNPKTLQPLPKSKDPEVQPLFWNQGYIQSTKDNPLMNPLYTPWSQGKPYGGSHHTHTLIIYIIWQTEP